MAKTPNVEKWGRTTAAKRYADGGRLETTGSFHEGIDYSDPDKDMNYHNKGSRGAIDEAFYQAKLPNPNAPGPTKANAEMNRIDNIIAAHKKGK